MSNKNTISETHRENQRDEKEGGGREIGNRNRERYRHRKTERRWRERRWRERRGERQGWGGEQEPKE